MSKYSEISASEHEWGLPKLWSNRCCHPPWWLLMSWGKARSSHLPLLKLNKETRFGPILECEVKWAAGSITTNKASGGDGIPVELFQILRDDAVKVLHSICQQIWKTQQCPQDWKRSIFIPIQKKGSAKECSNLRTIALISHASKIMLKILQDRFKGTWTVNFQMFRLDFEKAEEPEIKLSTSVGSSKKQESSRRTSTSALLTTSKPLTVWITTNCGTLKEMGIPYDLPPEKPVCRSRSNN